MRLAVQVEQRANATQFDALDNACLVARRLAVLAAGLFRLSTPLLRHWGRGMGAFTTAALLYAGAALVMAFFQRPASREAWLHRGDLLRLLAMAGCGAVIGPTALARGLQHTRGTLAALMLTLESVFSTLLARAFAFLGAAGAVLLGDRSGSAGLLWGDGLMLPGVGLHLLEAHSHVHTHDIMRHSHAQMHGNRHHQHSHQPWPDDAHSHWHELLPQVHAHSHMPDLHHQHRH